MGRQKCLTAIGTVRRVRGNQWSWIGYLAARINTLAWFILWRIRTNTHCGQQSLSVKAFTTASQQRRFHVDTRLVKRQLSNAHLVSKVSQARLVMVWLHASDLQCKWTKKMSHAKHLLIVRTHTNTLDLKYCYFSLTRPYLHGTIQLVYVQNMYIFDSTVINHQSSFKHTTGVSTWLTSGLHRIWSKIMTNLCYVMWPLKVNKNYS